MTVIASDRNTRSHTTGTSSSARVRPQGRALRRHSRPVHEHGQLELRPQPHRLLGDAAGDGGEGGGGAAVAATAGGVHGWIAPFGNRAIWRASVVVVATEP